MNVNGFNINGQTFKYNYNALENLPPEAIPKPSTNSNGQNGQILSSKGDGTTKWINNDHPTEEIMDEINSISTRTKNLININRLHYNKVTVDGDVFYGEAWYLERANELKSFFSDDFTFEPNQSYTLSFQCKNNLEEYHELSEISCIMLVISYEDDPSGMDSLRIGPYFSSNEYQKFSRTSDPNKTIKSVYIAQSTNGQIKPTWYIKNLMLEKGSVASEYVPYRENKIENRLINLEDHLTSEIMYEIDSISIKTENLININRLYDEGLTVDGDVIYGKAFDLAKASYKQKFLSNITFEPNQSYTLSYQCKINLEGNYALSQIYNIAFTIEYTDGGNVILVPNAVSNEYQKLSITSNSNKTIKTIRITSSYGEINPIWYIKNLMLTKGSTVIDYVPYRENKQETIIPEPPLENGSYILKATVSNNNIVYSWVTE